MSDANTIYASVKYNDAKYEGNIFLNDKMAGGRAQVGGDNVEDLENEIKNIKLVIQNYQNELSQMKSDKRESSVIIKQRQQIKKLNDYLTKKNEELLNAKLAADVAKGEQLIAQLPPLDSQAREATSTFTMPENLPTPPATATAATAFMPPQPPPSQIEQVNPSEKQRENSQIINPALILPTATGTNARRKLFTAAKQVISQNKLINSTQMDKGNINRDQNLLTDAAAAPEVGLDTTSGSDTGSGQNLNAVLDPASVNTDLVSSPIATSIKSAKKITLNANINGKPYNGVLTRKQTIADKISSAKSSIGPFSANAKSALSSAKGAIANTTRKIGKIFENPVSESSGGKTRNKRRRPRRRVTYKYKSK